MENFKSGFVTVIGRPNVGKSTLVNRIVGEKVAIVSNKPQTTRTRITAIYQDEESQIVFVDTPGVHKPRNKLGNYMVNAALTTMVIWTPCFLWWTLPKMLWMKRL